ncbi:hypothetical protein HYPSUDRAFT_651698 [Hypholoma sublateritium FD-334 SS-4]|uniref:C2H2-type domain-containing protein n=1 Tax=Hypholoma sublateritium (strain FD-334 SS-4) TaxID=945553 RepID=A0A0D2PRR6_HYPSF|nr:hypothetical protein HYPSUDRAFT_651698 [Hypholoma sublateritium FD-334 SS-4]
MQILGHGHSQSLGHGSLPSYSYTQGYPYHGVPIVSGSLNNSGAVPIPISSTGSASSDGYKLEGLSGSVADGSEAGGNGEKSSKPISISASANGKAKKRGVDYKCESCAKIYRHPNCLNKHRWEHTRQWREASKFVLSKHQQVQLLEAATILSFMGTTSTSLPDDRSEWPSFLSGGSLPKTEADGSSTANAVTAPSEYSSTPVSSGLGHSHYAPQQRTTTYALQPHLVSSSVPNVPVGPRMHDYALPAAGTPVKVTQVRPGLLGVPTNSSVGAANGSAMVHGSPTAMPTGEGGWSLPSSALRSDSYASRGRSGSRSRSRSGSGSRSDESLDIAVDIEGMDEEPDVRVASVNSAVRGAYAGYPAYGSVGLSNSPGYGYAAHVAGYGYGHGYPGRRSVGMKREEDEMSVGFSVREEDEEDEEEDDVAQAMGTHESKWDGMEMELDMDMD